jgi:outer membrane protein assembly factor BamE (lipoprotein component of BamABCDE complex)
MSNYSVRAISFVAFGGLLLSACALQRAQVANEAQQRMVGKTKEQVFACMGAPVNKAVEGSTEVWSYASGDGHTETDVSGGRFWASGTSTQRYCKINVTMTSGQVVRMNYIGPTGGLITPGEQCAYALQNCMQQ